MNKTLLSAALVAALAAPTAVFAQDQPQGSSNAVDTNQAVTSPVTVPPSIDQPSDQPQGSSNAVDTNRAATDAAQPADADQSQVAERPAWGNTDVPVDQQIAANMFWAEHPEITGAYEP
jgi:hypothetical protein